MKKLELSKLKILCLIIILISNCKLNCPEDETYGTKKLNNESISKIPYFNYDKVIFTNSEGREISYLLNNFDHDGKEIYWQISLGKICGEGESGTDLFIESEIINGQLFQEPNRTDQSIDFYVNLSVQNKNLENPFDTILVDEIQIWSYLNNTLYVGPPPIQSEIKVISSNRGNMLESNNRTDQNFIESIRLLDKEFTDIYVNDNLLKIYYNFSNGIVGFEDKEEDLWVFDRFE